MNEETKASLRMGIWVGFMIFFVVIALVYFFQNQQIMKQYKNDPCKACEGMYKAKCIPFDLYNEIPKQKQNVLEPVNISGLEFVK